MDTTENMGGVFDLASYNDLEGKAAGAENSTTVQVGTESNPLIIKLAFDPRWGNHATFLEVSYHKFYSQYSNVAKSARSFLCLKNYGEKCPACDARYSAWKEKEKLVKAGQAIPKQMTEILDLFKGSTKAWCIVIQPNADSVRALKIPYSLQLLLFGGMDRQNNKVKGLVNEMRERGRSPFDLKASKGWLKVWKTGEELNTKYFASECYDAVIEVDDNGEETEKRKYFTANVGSKIFSLTLDDIPVCLDLEYDSAKWNAAEVLQYVKTDGIDRPARAMMQVRTDGGATAQNTAPSSNDGCTEVKDFETPPWAQQVAPASEENESVADLARVAKEESAKKEPLYVEANKAAEDAAKAFQSTVAKTAPVAQAVQQKQPTKPRKVIDDLDDLA